MNHMTKNSMILAVSCIFPITSSDGVCKQIAIICLQPSARGRYLGNIDPYGVPEEGAMECKKR